MSVVHVHARDRVLAISPLHRHEAGLIAAIARAGSLGVLDLGRDRARAERALAALAGREIGVRVPDGCPIRELPAQVSTVIAMPGDVARWLPRRVIAEVTSIAEARAAIAAGATGVIAKGCEAGGRIGDETTFVLLQRLV